VSNTDDDFVEECESVVLESTGDGELVGQNEIFWVARDEPLHGYGGSLVRICTLLKEGPDNSYTFVGNRV